MAYFTIAQPDGVEVVEAYALVRTFAPDVSPALWAAFIARHPDGQGILIARGPAGLVLGLASYAIDGTDGPAGALLVENFITIEFGAGAPVRKALTEELERIAAERRCSGVHQLIPCGLPGTGTFRNHLRLADASGLHFNRGSDCSCESAAVTAAGAAQ